MADGWALALALAAVAGALQPHALPLALGVALAALGLRARRPAVLCLGVVALASTLSARAWAGLEGVESRAAVGTIALVTDPAPAPRGVRADATFDGRRYELRATGEVAAQLRERLAGERLVVRGQVAPAPPDAPWLVPRHVAGTLTIHRIERALPAPPAHRAANSVRRVLAKGAAPLTPPQRALFMGLVIGDDRAQEATQTDAFRGAGLTHLLAVSGQNVAFVLVLVGPLARRFSLWPRLVVTLTVIALFGLMTRFEPSVLRASAMAALAAIAMTAGAPMARLRVLALAVTGLVLVDPLLVHSIGFRLSALAAAAIVAVGEPIARALPGPRWLAVPAGVTLAAQLGVAPVLLTSFGPIPVASIPANLLAVPVAGLVMVWGLTAGVIAGIVGDVGAALLHLPTRALLGWIDAVAARAAAAPLGELRAPHVLGLALGLGAAILTGGRRRRLGLALAGFALAAAVVAAAVPAPLRSRPAPGLVRWHASGTEVVVVGGGGWRASVGIETALEELRRAGVGAIDLLVVADDRVVAPVVEALVEQHPTGLVLVPRGSEVVGEVVPSTGVELDVGALSVTVVQGEDRLVVEARPHDDGRR